MSSLDRILPFLRPIEDLLRDPAITELMVNDGGRRVFVERAGGVELVKNAERRIAVDEIGADGQRRKAEARGIEGHALRLVQAGIQRFLLAGSQRHLRRIPHSGKEQVEDGFDLRPVAGSKVDLNDSLTNPWSNRFECYVERAFISSVVLVVVYAITSAARIQRAVQGRGDDHELFVPASRRRSQEE